MIRLYLVRHCETLALTGDAPANPRGDAPLSPAGVEQARRLGELLREWPVDLVLTSLYLRAVRTAQGAMRDREPPVPVHASLALNELLPRDDGEMETEEEGLARALAFLDQFRPRHENILVVAHDAILSALRRSFLGMPGDDGDYFADPGRTRVLHHDGEAGDDGWREVATFAP
ncbi:MAG TPA: phosphoglycerate mutase family protein [Longimicrobium sp.]|nr:phosphoglycerate mutase family protein [Longimicrobium sp.]